MRVVYVNSRPAKPFKCPAHDRMNPSSQPDNPFSLLGLACRFDIDFSTLEQAYFEALSHAHPDRFQDPFEQADAADRSSRINEAFQTLKDPLQRAEALIALITDGGHDARDLPEEFLMQMMEMREYMETAIADQDHVALARLKSWADDQQEQHLARIASLFQAHQAGDQATSLQQQINALRYIQRMIEQMPR